ncbi:hypothetical protein Fsol_00390 [Candidatus Fokinia solitaria]|uniref:Uncharacterized protein n=2 Tax=Candidatus Fokinia solitaria TaxID=1802984 RepID=A0A2U8BS71_9RICK|nr:hypothetical protein Fsol_00390 [Candidatus Fokinia solitaria]
MKLYNACTFYAMSMSKDTCKKERLARQLRENLVRRKEVVRTKKSDVNGIQGTKIKQGDKKDEN